MTGCWRVPTVALLLFAFAVAPGRADPLEDCNSADPAKMLTGCTAVLAAAKTPEERLAALARRGFAEKQSGKCDAAIADLTAALQLSPNIASVLTLRGECYANLNQVKPAHDDLEAALRLDPQNAEARAAMSRLAPAASASAAAPVAAATPGSFDGTWSVSEVCPPVDSTLGIARQFTVQVLGGAFHAEQGVQGQPGWLMWDGKITGDGVVTIKATGLLSTDTEHRVSKAPPGTPFEYEVEGQLSGTTGTAKRKSGRACELGFVKQSAQESTMTGVGAASRITPAAPTPAKAPVSAALPGSFDGAWVLTQVCQPMGTTLGYTTLLTVQIVDGAFHAEQGVRGQPGWGVYDGKVAEDGAVMIKYTGLLEQGPATASNAPSGTPWGFEVEGRLTGTTGTGKRKSQRACDWGFVKQ